MYPLYPIHTGACPCACLYHSLFPIPQNKGYQTLDIDQNPNPSDSSQTHSSIHRIG